MYACHNGAKYNAKVRDVNSVSPCIYCLILICWAVRNRKRGSIPLRATNFNSSQWNQGFCDVLTVSKRPAANGGGWLVGHPRVADDKCLVLTSHISRFPPPRLSQWSGGIKHHICVHPPVRRPVRRGPGGTQVAFYPRLKIPGLVFPDANQVMPPAARELAARAAVLKATVTQRLQRVGADGRTTGAGTAESPFPSAHQNPGALKPRRLKPSSDPNDQQIF
jgi:hypothetical protein